MDLHSGRPLAKPEIASLLAEARGRTLLLVAPLSAEDLRTRHDVLMSPIVWDLGHIAHFEEVWLLENVDTGGAGSEGLRGVYNSFENPRAARDKLPLPSRDECHRYMAEVRRAVLTRLERLDLEGTAGPLLRDGFVFRMVLQHEYRHNETMLQTLQLKRGKPYAAPRALVAPRPECGGDVPAPGTMVHFPGGEVIVGTDDRSAAYDNERPAHTVHLDPFWIDAHPVTNGQYLAFIEAGGYDRVDLWSQRGWAWRMEAGLSAPQYWDHDGSERRIRVMDRTRPIDHDRPVCHVSYWEAEAYARFEGKRLPTEFEWEAAASWDPLAGEKRAYPWGAEAPHAGLANLDVLAFDTAPVGSYPRNVSPVGCRGMIGDVWEWTSTDFHGYPGYETFPYREYSEVFFGDGYKVLRGGSWATRPGAIRSTFRSWDYPIRRQIFSGIRCARDD